MTQEDFMANLGNVQQLCKMDASNTMPRGNNRLNESVSAYDGDADAWDRMYLSESDDDSYDAKAESALEHANDIMLNKKAVEKSRIPSFIKDSMVNENIDRTALANNPLDRMDLSKYHTKSTPKRTISEQAVVASAPSVINGVDYTIIKAIINECLDTKLKEYGIGKVNLDENTLKTIHLKGGTIKLVDNSGNIYSAQLEKRGNINESKK